MPLSNLIIGRQERPLRISLYGVDGVGKSTFAAGAPSAIFIGAEDGTAHLDVTRFPQPTTFNDIMQNIGVLYTEEHEFKTLVLDSLDWAETLANSEVCVDAGTASIEDLGYGKGHVKTAEKMISLLAAFDALYQKGMNIITISHSQVATFNDPENAPYDRYRLKLDKRFEPKVREWCDYNLFCNFDTIIKQEGDGFKKQNKGVSFGKRNIFTQRTAAYDAKSRYAIPKQLPLSWDTFWAAHSEAKANLTINPSTAPQTGE